MNQFVYFFKHTAINAIKIGKTSGESVNDRFSQFKTYSPYGSEIVGFFKCDDAMQMERKLHEQFKERRLHGEWFDISVEVALAIIDKYDKTESKIKKIFNEWIADEANDIGRLSELMRKTKITDVLDVGAAIAIEGTLIEKTFHPCEINKGLKMSATKIKEYLESRYSKSLSLKKIGMELRRMGFSGMHVKVSGVTQKLYHLTDKDIE